MVRARARVRGGALSERWERLQAFGSDFIHGGNSYSLPPYQEPMDLLNEPTVDKMQPFIQSPKTVGDYYGDNPNY